MIRYGTYPIRSRAAPVSGDKGDSAASLAGGLSIVAASGPAVSIAKQSAFGRVPHESALPGLHDGAGELRAREVELGHDRPVELDAALADHAPRVARRETECGRK